MSINHDLARKLGLNSQEITLLDSCKTPEDFQHYINSKKYNYKDVFHSFRQAQLAEEINCFGGAIMGAAYVFFSGLGPPMIMCMEASHNDSDHNVATYWTNGRLGSLTASRNAELTGRPAIFNSYADLALSYYPSYRLDASNDTGPKTLRGFCAPVDLRLFGERWLLAIDSLTEIESYLYSIPYLKLFPYKSELYADTVPACGDFYYSPHNRGEFLRRVNGR